MPEAIYTLDELSRLWKVTSKTISNWLWLERSNGGGPTGAQHITRAVRGKKTLFLRADYADDLQRKYVFREKK